MLCPADCSLSFGVVVFCYGGGQFDQMQIAKTKILSLCKKDNGANIITFDGGDGWRMGYVTCLGCFHIGGGRYVSLLTK